MPVKMRHTYIVIVINNHIIKEILLKSLIGYCKFPCVGDKVIFSTSKYYLANSKDRKDTFTNYIMIRYEEGIHNYSY